MNIRKYFTIKNLIVFITFVLILATSIIFGQKPLLVAPVFVSLFIMASQAEANRYSYLAAGLNCVVYTFVYIYLGLYASALSCFLFSFPFQIVTFVKWNKRSYGKSTMFRKMSASLRLMVFAGFAVCFVVVYIVLKSLGSEYAILDNMSTLIGIMVSVLTVFAYIEYSYLWLLSAGVQLALNIQVMLNNPAHITYVIFSLYCAYCIVLAFINVRKLYKEQRSQLHNDVD